MTLDPNAFFEKYIFEIRKTAIWAQGKLFSISRTSIKAKESALEILRRNYEQNFENIFRLEKDIEKVRERDLKVKLKNLKIFECLNAEKASPHFLNIAKKTCSEATPNDIKDENGNDFPSDEERENHIINFFRHCIKRKNHSTCV